MKVTKYTHACLFVEKDGNKLVVDPGKFTELPDDLSGINLVIVTEEHLDHFDVDNLKKIVKQSPEVKVYSTKPVHEKCKEDGLLCYKLEGNNQFEEFGFRLELKEGDHAPVYLHSPCRVLTLRIDDFLYYPSDSYILPDRDVDIIALPTSGPWYKISESIEFVNSTKSKSILVTHNGLYNDTGNQVTDNFININLDNKERQWVHLKEGESREF